MSAILETKGEANADIPKKNAPDSIPIRNFDIPRYVIRNMNVTGRTQLFPSFIKWDNEVKVSILIFIGID